MIVHMLCSVVGDDSDDMIRICLLCNVDVDSDDDEADVQKSVDDEASIEKSDDDEAAIEIPSDEEVDIESCDEEYIERVPDPQKQNQLKNLKKTAIMSCLTWNRQKQQVRK